MLAGLLRSWRWRSILLSVSLIVIIRVIWRSPEVIYKDGKQVFVNNSDIRLHILIPASNRNLGLCKTVLSAAVLDYPTPTLVQWGRRFTDESKLGEGFHTAKLLGILDWLNHLEPEQDHDLVLIIDSSDVLFQLRPSVLVNRYQTINREALRRIAKRMGLAMKAENISQSIIFGSSKQCSPNSPEDIGCLPVPESPLPRDMYGNNTDTEVGYTQHSSFRPRYLNSDVILGPVFALRPLYSRAWDIHDQANHEGSDQFVFNTIFGEQELQRKYLREKHLSSVNRFVRYILSIFRSADSKNDLLNSEHFAEQIESIQDGIDHEFGILLDYSALLSHETEDGEHDGRYLTYSAIKTLGTLLATPAPLDCKPHLKTLPVDITASDPPLPRVKPGVETITPQSWKEVPLYTQMCTGEVPVMIHHNGVGGEDGWMSLWSQKYAKHLLEIRHKMAGASAGEEADVEVVKPLDASMRIPAYTELTGKDKNVDPNVGNVLLDSGELIEWWDLCTGQGFEKDLFRGM